MLDHGGVLQVAGAARQSGSVDDGEVIVYVLEKK